MDRVEVLYDEDCGFCRWSAGRLLGWDRHDHVRCVAIGSPEGQALLSGVPEALRPGSMHAVTPDGRVWSAGAAVGPILRTLPGGRLPAAVADAFPGLTERAYRAVARRRGALGRMVGEHACAVDPSAARR